MMKKILVFCGKDDNPEKVERLIKEVNGFDFLLFNDDKLLLNSIAESRPETLLIHKTDFSRLISESSFDILDAAPQIILVGDGLNENSIHPSNRHWFANDFTKEDLPNPSFRKESDNKQFQEHLNHDYHYLDMLMEYIPDRIYFKDKDSRFILANKALANMFGKENPEDLIGKTDFDFFDTEHVRQAFDDEQELMASGIPLVGKIESHLQDGEQIWETTTKIPLFNSENAIIGMVGISRDFTRQKQLEDSLKKERDLLQILMDNVPDCIFFKDLDLKYIRANKAVGDSLQIADLTDIYGKCDHDLFPPEMADIFLNNEKEVLQSGKAVINKIENYLSKEGTPVWLSTTKIPARDENGKITGIVGISSDITMQELTKQRFRIAKEKAEEDNKAKSMFLANMSHEIRTPMNGVIGMADILSRTELNPEQQEYLDIIMKSGQTLLVLVNDILDFSKIESGKLVLESVPISIRSIVEEVADIQTILAANKSIDLITYVDPRVPGYVKGDYVRLKQVITNLVNNAIKFTSRGEVCIQAEYVRSIGTAHEILFNVKDSGIGISREDQKKLFKSFSQVDASTTREYGGTGLGLAISRNLVKKMGGKLQIESEKGKGSVFYFIAGFDVAPDQNGVYLNLKNISLEKLTVLVVDDNPTNRRIFREYLLKIGITAKESSGGEEALVELSRLKADGTPADIVLVDYQMPGMDGIQLAQAIKNDELLRASHLVLLSSVTDDLPTDELKKAGIDYSLNKPVKMKQLFNIIASIVDAPEQVNVNQKPEEENADAFKDYSFLIVEDNEVNMRVAHLALQKLTSKISFARDGFEAISVFTSENPDFILMDIQMPGMNGIEASIQIREIEKLLESDNPVKIIAMTANTLQEDIEKCLNSGMDAFLEKPFKINDLVNVLKSM